ncbi:MAG: hypothetical protein WD469_07480 [Paenibacillaceae bacterium]
MSSLDEVVQLLNVDSFKDTNGYALRLNGKRIFVNKWNTGTSFIKEIKQEMLWQIIAWLKAEPGLVSSKSIEDFQLIKYIEPYVIRINFPPTFNDYYVDIYKIGTASQLDPRIPELWADKTAYYWLRDFIDEIFRLNRFV